jgi:hypothetical protein
MSLTISYTHVYDYRNFSGLGILPLVSVQLFYGSAKVWTGKALLDSGATYSAFDANIAVQLGIDISKLPKERIRGVGGSSLMYRQRMGIRVGPMLKPMACQIYFIEGHANRNLPNLIGRDGVFNHLQIGIDEANKKIYMALNS